MAGNTQMNENERGIFKLSGITGMLIATVLLLTILVVLTISSIKVQQDESTNFYKINQDLNGLTSGSFSSDMKQKTPAEQNENYQLIGNGK
jgi:ABC-type phosphate transport system permease subunit